MKDLNAKNLKLLRIKADLSQSELADILGVTQSAVTNWERGNTQPSVDRLPKLAEVFGCTIDELYGEK